MFKSVSEILITYPHVFKNETNERIPVAKHLRKQTVMRENWQHFTIDNVDQTLLLTKDKNGIIQCYSFFECKGKPAYSEIAQPFWVDLDFKDLK